MGEVASVRELVEWGRRPQRGLGLVAKIPSVAAWAFGREIKSKRKASHRGHRGHRGGFGVGGQNSIGGSVRRLGEKSGATESIAQRSQRPQRGIWGGWPKFYRWQRGRLGEKSSPRGKHRTEVTEATEGDWGGWPKFYRWQRERLGEKSSATESIAQRSRRPQRGSWGGWPKSIGGSVGVWARNQVQGESIAQRSRREMGFVVKDSISCSGVRSMRNVNPSVSAL